MNHEAQHDIGEMTDVVRNAIRNGTPDRVEAVPREAVVRAAAHGLVDFEIATLNRSESTDLDQLGKEVNGCLKILSEDERAEAQARAEVRLEELVDY